MALPEFTPLCVRAWLRSPVIADMWLPLDGLLYYQAHREAGEGDQPLTQPGQSNARPGLRLPLAVEHDGEEDWYYRCSWAVWPEHTVDGADYWNKRFDADFADYVDFADKRGKVIVESGRHKAYHSHIFYRSALWIEWYCLGDGIEIERLLQTMTHIGKKGAQGWGRVIRWEVETMDADYSVRADTRLMRGVPLRDGAAGLPVGNYGVRPSYWERANQMTLCMPGVAS